MRFGGLHAEFACRVEEGANQGKAIGKLCWHNVFEMFGETFSKVAFGTLVFSGFEVINTIKSLKMPSHDIFKGLIPSCYCRIR
jgi:hypothetical protein